MRKEPNMARRVLIYAVMAFCMSMLVWLMWNGQQDGELHKLIAEGCFYTMGALVLFYVLGGNFDLALHVLAARFAPGASAQAAASHAPKGQATHDRPSTMAPP